jgi:predicted Ser/Thr protein kinase
VADRLARARPGDPAALTLARASVAGALFGPEAGHALGRFRVLERLGAGGMGVVYAAYDPELDRRVALKLVAVAGAGRDRALAEAKALARLSHPNVVPIYDVGADGDHVYLVMELVPGETLRRWARGRRPREILDAYRQAGRALAAAHAAGLVHRDFKPDNAIIGTDRRVRVVDFGLACESEAAPPNPAGTPRYMAPEQAADGRVTPAADQYSFCVALAEALTGTGATLPRWVTPVLERGRATDPGARYPSMIELLRALGRDPARIRRRRVALAAAMTLAAAAFVVGRAVPATGALCREDPTDDAPVTAEARGQAVARVAASGRYGRWLAPQLAGTLGDYVRRWRGGARAACRAFRGGGQSANLFDRRMACLGRARAALGVVVELGRHAEAHALPDLARAMAALPEPERCGDAAALVTEVEPPPAAIAADVARLRAELARARVLVAAGRFGEAGAAAARCVSEARGLGYQPLLAEALLVAGHAAMMATPDAAAPLLAEATRLAARAGDDATAVEAWARRAQVEGTRGDPDAALAGLDMIEDLAARPRAGAFARALLHNNLGSVELARDRREAARAAFSRALVEAAAATGPGALELLAVRSNLALVTDDRARAEALLVAAEAERARRFGPAHPDTLQIRFLRATLSTADLGATARLLDETCPGYEVDPALETRAVRCWAELGFVLGELGQDAAAAESLARASGRASVEAPEVGPYLALLRGDARAAEEGFATALAAAPNRPSDPWWARVRRAGLTLGLGRARRALGDLDGARAALAPCVDELAAHARAHPATALGRRLGRARVELALTLAAQGSPPERVAPVAGAAAAWLREAGGRATEAETLERLAGAGAPPVTVPGSPR